MEYIYKPPTRAQISRVAIQRMYITMRHLFFRGSYKPLGKSSEGMAESLIAINPEIYGSIADPERVELNGLLYVLQRLPQGIEECRSIHMMSREGYDTSSFEPIIPPKRRRNCYRIDPEQMYIELTRGGSDVYDILTHLTFMYNEAEKIRQNSLRVSARYSRPWTMLTEIVEKIKRGEPYDIDVALSYLCPLLGRTYVEVKNASKKFDDAEGVNDLFRISYSLGQRSLEEFQENRDREITFSPALRATLGIHMLGEVWAFDIKNQLHALGLIDRPLHIISANMHSVLNTLFAEHVLNEESSSHGLMYWAEKLSQSKNEDLRQKVRKYALLHGMTEMPDQSGTNIDTQLFDLDKLPQSLKDKWNIPASDAPVIFVMDYAFGEQAYETLDELLKPFEIEEKKIPLRVASVNIMGKAGILAGKKGDIMIATAHVFEGSADNYPFKNELDIRHFEKYKIPVFKGTMISVLGTSLQNKDVLNYFLKSSWKAIGLEMEGAHYQKAIQVASKIRHNISPRVKLRYAYYASDNPLETGSTLASGSLGADGVKPTYAITIEMIKQILHIK